MKTLSGRFRFVVIGVIAMVAVVSCCYFPPTLGTKSYATVEITRELRGKKIPRYVEWKDDGAKFKQALEQVRGHNGEYCICVLEKSGAKPYRYPHSKCFRDYDCPPENIKTVKVTKSEAADDIAAGESAANDPNAMHRVQSPDPRDIIDVLKALDPKP